MDRCVRELQIRRARPTHTPTYQQGGAGHSQEQQEYEYATPTYPSENGIGVPVLPRSLGEHFQPAADKEARRIPQQNGKAWVCSQPQREPSERGTAVHSPDRGAQATWSRQKEGRGSASHTGRAAAGHSSKGSAGSAPGPHPRAPTPRQWPHVKLQSAAPPTPRPLQATPTYPERR